MTKQSKKLTSYRNSSLSNLFKFKNVQMPNLKPAFTLAEVLITLGIIGIVASYTITTLMNNTNKKETIVAVKKAYSTLSQAYIMAVQENGTPDGWVSSDEEMYNAIIPYLSVTKDCGGAAGCFPDVIYKRLTGADWVNLSGIGAWNAILSDGSLLFSSTYGDCNNVKGLSITLQNACGWFGIDINGAKSPNQLGVDFFAFYLTKKGIVPLGTALDTSFLFDGDCKNITTARGYGCTAWVLYNENMDYLKPCGTTLSWDGLKTCN